MKYHKPIIGIPKALLYYKYGNTWANFLVELGFEVIYSPSTNSKLLERGKSLIIDESCLSLKIYMGHIDYLVDKADYILIPRIGSLYKKEKMCTNFNALYDIVNTVFKINILEFNIDVEKGFSEKKAFLLMGKKLKKSRKETIRAYLKAKRMVKRELNHKIIKQNLLLESKEQIKILLVAHSYNIYDNLIGNTIVEHLNKEGVNIIYSDLVDEKESKDKYIIISEKVYWTYSKELLNSIIHYYDKIDGVILLSVFPCGPDSLINEMCLRKIKKPITAIIVDELSSDAGLQTRIESFIDIIKKRKEDS